MIEDLKISNDQFIQKQRNDPAWQQVIANCLESESLSDGSFVLENETLYKIGTTTGYYLLVILYTVIESVLKLYLFWISIINYFFNI